MSTRISAGIDDCPCSSTFYLLIVKLQNFPYDCLFTLFGNNYDIDELTSVTSKERMTKNIIFTGATLIN